MTQREHRPTEEKKNLLNYTVNVWQRWNLNTEMFDIKTQALYVITPPKMSHFYQEIRIINQEYCFQNRWKYCGNENKLLCLIAVTLKQQSFLTEAISNLCPFKLIKAAPVYLKRKIRANNIELYGNYLFEH